MITTLEKSGSFWIERNSGESLTDEDLHTLLASAPEGIKIRIIILDNEDEPEEDSFEKAVDDT